MRGRGDTWAPLCYAPPQFHWGLSVLVIRSAHRPPACEPCVVTDSSGSSSIEDSSSHSMTLNAFIAAEICQFVCQWHCCAQARHAVQCH